MQGRGCGHFLEIITQPFLGFDGRHPTKRLFDALVVVPAYVLIDQGEHLLLGVDRLGLHPAEESLPRPRCPANALRAHGRVSLKRSMSRAIRPPVIGMHQGTFPGSVEAAFSSIRLASSALGLKRMRRSCHYRSSDRRRDSNLGDVRQPLLVRTLGREVRSTRLAERRRLALVRNYTCVAWARAPRALPPP